MKKIVLLFSLCLLFLVSCEEKKEVIYQEQPVQEKIYVRDDSGKWMEYAIFMALMQQQHRSVDINHYHYGTSNGNGGFNDYRPSSTEFNQMKNRTYKGTTTINKKVIVNKNITINKNYNSSKKSIKKTKTVKKTQTIKSTFKKTNYKKNNLKRRK